MKIFFALLYIQLINHINTLINQIFHPLAFAAEKFPDMRCRSIAAQFMPGEIIALFELTLDDSQVKVVEERHYKLVPANELDKEAIRSYRTSS